MQTVKTETSVLNLVLNGFLQTSISPLIFIFYAKDGVSRFCVENVSSHSAEKIRRETLRCFRKLRVSKNFIYNFITIFRRKLFVSQYQNISYSNPSLFQEISGIVWHSRISWIRMAGITILCCFNKVKKCEAGIRT